MAPPNKSAWLAGERERLHGTLGHRGVTLQRAALRAAAERPRAAAERLVVSWLGVLS